ncbi:MAG: MotA/TolQ/ExbB proton channel family protein, partial [Planctomycetota bacterium]
MSRITTLSEWLLRQAAIWGGLACLAFYALVRQADASSALFRYFDGDGREVKYATTLLFFVGMATLVIRGLGLIVQFGALDRTRISPAASGGDSVEDADRLLAELAAGPSSLHDSYLVRRLRLALRYVKEKGSADSLEGQLQRLEESDLQRMHHSYASVRIIASTIPILGFLGTVIGITLAIAKLSGQQMEESLPAVISGLSVAFDTTALALALSILLLFAKFAVERVDASLLAAVDDRVCRQMLGRFRQYGSTNDPHLASVQRISEKVLETVESTAQIQSERLSAALDQAHKEWESMAASTGEALNQSLAKGLAAGLGVHADSLNRGVQKHTADLEAMLVRHAEILAEGVDRHAELLNDGAQRQVDVLAEGLDAVTSGVNQGLTTLATGLAEGLEHHTVVMTETEKSLAEENRKHLADVEAAVGEAMLVATTRQEKLVKQSEDILGGMQVALVEAAGS